MLETKVMDRLEIEGFCGFTQRNINNNNDNNNDN